MSEQDLVREPSVPPRYSWRVIVSVLVIAMLALAATSVIANSARPSFPTGERVVVPEGASLASISALLDNTHVVRSAFLFRTFIIFFGAQTSLQAGTHVFDAPLTTYEVARAFIEQTSSLPLVRITIPEGSTLTDIDTLVTTALPLTQLGDIIRLAERKEGILFPDTYFFTEDTKGEAVVKLLRDTFTIRLAPLEAQMKTHTLSKEEIIILASIVEREANDEASMRLVAGILLERLRLGMPLQVDATFAYLIGKTSKELTSEDLKLDSPFNTYLYPGLPPSAIGSPGMMAIEAVLSPTESESLYYLTDSEGVFYYARTFDDHKVNKARYLR